MLRVRYIFLTLAAVVCTTIQAQRHEIYDEQIRTLQVVANEDWLSMPVMKLNEGFVDIDFDDLTHEYRRYIYKVEHCEADWKVSEEIFESDYVAGFAYGNTIDDVQESLLTNVLYSHYHLRIPNANCRLKMSGNYKVTVYNDNDDSHPILTACFMVVDTQMGVVLRGTTNTDVDVNMSHQQIAMDVNYSGHSVVNQEAQIKTVVLQNGRWDDARWNTKPQYIMPDGLRWEHNKSLIFDAGNIYHKFEILSTDHASMGVERIGWDGENYHAYPEMAVPRTNYIYDESANGAFYIRNSDNYNNDYQSEYMWVHFRLKCPERVSNGSVFLNGDWTYDRFLPEYQMIYNEEKKMYEGTVLLKQGYYSYQFLVLDKNGNTHPMPTEGNFYQTKNNYQAFVYYREQGGRTDKLVGYHQISFPAQQGK